MILYHGSKRKLETLKPRQATSPPDERAADIPKDELLNGIYLTSEFDFALAMAARPLGVTEVNVVDGKKTIKFEHPELFNPEQPIYIHEIDTAHIPKENLKQVDEKQFVVVDLKELAPLNVQEMKARELLKYYELINWKENTEIFNEGRKGLR